MRRGLRVLALAVREEPWVFAVALAGSALYGVMTVISAVVLGRVTERVVLPAFRYGQVTTGALIGGSAVIVAVAVVKATGIVFRRIGASRMQFRLQATYRQRVTRQYLRLPLSWHQQHPTGELLSNANADVEATWWAIPPFPFAMGVLVMLAVTGVALVVTDPVLAVVGFAVFPAIGALNFGYNQRLTPLITRAQHLRGELSTVAHESFDGALVVKALGREAAETARFAATANELRDEMVRVGRVHGLFDPLMEALPQLGTLLVLLVGAGRIQDRPAPTSSTSSVPSWGRASISGSNRPCTRPTRTISSRSSLAVAANRAVSAASRPRVLTTSAPSKLSCATVLSSPRRCCARVTSGVSRWL